jgi:glucan endo-1,3-beta-D-glucosidase
VLVSYITQNRVALKGTALADVLIGHTEKAPAWVTSSNFAPVEAVDWLVIDLQHFLDSTSSNSTNNDSTNFQDE